MKFPLHLIKNIQDNDLPAPGVTKR